MNLIETEAKIASNLIALAIDNGMPVSFSQSDIDAVLTGDISDSEKLNQLRRIRMSIHEILYAPPRR